MNWKKWRIGLVVAVACGALTAGAGVSEGMGGRAFVAVLCTSLLTNLLNFLKTHPLDDVDPPTPPPPKP